MAKATRGWLSCSRGRLGGVSFACRVLFLLAGLTGAASTARCATWYVEADPSAPEDRIGQVLAGAASGDSVIIGAGTYYEHIVLSDKEITLIGSDGPYQTMLDGSRQFEGRGGSVIYSNRSLWIEGLTLTQGTGSEIAGRVAGGAICSRTAARLDLTNCRIVDNHSTTPIYGSGGGLYVTTAGSVNLRDCYFTGNRTSGAGSTAVIDAGFVAVEECDVEIDYAGDLGLDVFRINCETAVISGNHFSSSADDGYAIFLNCGSRDLTMTENTCVAISGHLACRVELFPPRGSSPDARARIAGNCLWAEMPSDEHEFGTFVTECIAEDNMFVRTPFLINGGEFVVARNLFFGPNACQLSMVGEASCNVSWPSEMQLPPNHQWVSLDRNVVADPLLCSDQPGDFTVAETSPCMAPNAPAGCGTIGSAVVGCQLSPVEIVTWGRIKAAFR